MKKALTIISLCALSLMATDIKEPDFKGFLGVQSCVQNGIFSDCDLKKYHDGDKIVAVIDGQTYQVDKQNMSQIKIDSAIMKNNIAFFGKIEGNVLKLNDLAFAAGKKEFNKSCM